MTDQRKPYSKPVLKRLKRTPETEYIFRKLEKDYPALRQSQKDNPETEEKPEDGSKSK